MSAMTVSRGALNAEALRRVPMRSGGGLKGGGGRGRDIPSRAPRPGIGTAPCRATSASRWRSPVMPAPARSGARGS